jgi:hypothetical protein
MLQVDLYWWDYPGTQRQDLLTNNLIFALLTPPPPHTLLHDIFLQHDQEDSKGIVSQTIEYFGKENILDFRSRLLKEHEKKSWECQRRPVFVL